MSNLESWSDVVVTRSTSNMMGYALPMEEQTDGVVDPLIPVLVNATQAGELLGVSQAHVGRLYKTGRLPGRRVGRALMFRRAAVLAMRLEREE